MSQAKEAVMAAVSPTEPAQVVQVGDFDRAVLEELEEPFQLIDVPLAEIDLDRSRRVLNQVRLGLGAVKEEHVETLATVLEQGGLLPPGIAHRDPEGHLVILSGNHRFPAYKSAGRASMPMYLATGLERVPTTDPRAQDVALRANVAHGDPVTTEHRIEQSARLVESGHYSIKEAARALRVPEGKLRDHVEKIKSRRRLAEAGVPLSDKDIPISVARRLNAIGSDEVLKAAAKLVPLMAQKAEETNRLVVAVNDARSERDQLAIIAEKAKELEAAGTAQAKARGVKGGALVSPKIRRLDGALGVVIRFETDALKSTMPAEFRDRLRDRIDEAVQALTAMRGQI
jgi:ParB-like chromosome segregation protein Spo0J